MIDLNKKRMNVIKTAENGVVNHETIFSFGQKMNRVYARYNGGRVTRGMLVGKLIGTCLDFKYVQVHDDGGIASGESTCNISVEKSGKLTMVENFDWADGTGCNVFAEVE